MKLWENYFVIIDQGASRKVIAILTSYAYNLMVRNNWEGEHQNRFPEQQNRFNVVRVYAPSADIAKDLAWNNKALCYNCEKQVDEVENEEKCCNECFERLYALEYERISHYERMEHMYVFGID